ncbi:hypothetical protein [Jannaschia sp. W003]|uniref:hypothetical protein n=1 Tax=Jannaschia sp. W003 TaxID=2867012 RepID=UPI0021A4D5A4|nr:hypothetical protein [Jannaschia sp. W003]UWQ20845.1 hypothetical protein K3554_12820 [Jannaschia sp. W003]
MAGIAPAGDAAAQADAPLPGLDRALAEAMVRVAAGAGLDAMVERQSCARAPRDTALAGLPGHALILPLRAPPGEWAGAVVLDPSLTDALVEIGTLGRAERTARKARPPTRIDASFARPFAAQVLAGAEGRHGTARYPAPDPGRHVADMRALALEVEAPSLVVAELALALGAERAGTLRLVLPDRPRAALPGPAVPEGSAKASRSEPEPDRARETLLRAHVRLEATLPPLSIPLARLTALRVGDTVPLPLGALGGLRLAAGRLGGGHGGPRGEGALRARLGQQDGMRAAKLQGARPAAAPAAEGAAAPGGALPDLGDAAAAPPARVARPPATAPQAARPEAAAPPAAGLPALADLDDMADLSDLKAM